MRKIIFWLRISDGGCQRVSWDVSKLWFFCGFRFSFIPADLFHLSVAESVATSRLIVLGEGEGILREKSRVETISLSQGHFLSLYFIVLFSLVVSSSVFFCF